jgi:hypothetical protein
MTLERVTGIESALLAAVHATPAGTTRHYPIQLPNLAELLIKRRRCAAPSRPELGHDLALGDLAAT